MRYLMYQPAMPDTASHASTRRQARTDGGGGEKESSVPELCSLESVCGQACVYRHIARCVFTTIFINHRLGVISFRRDAKVQLALFGSLALIFRRRSTSTSKNQRECSDLQLTSKFGVYAKFDVKLRVTRMP